MSIKQKKYGFVYIWYDRKHRRFYIGSHWGTVDDGYICSSRWMRKAYKRRPEDFKRRILSIINKREELLDKEQEWLDLIKNEEIQPLTETPRYYNLTLTTKNPWFHDENQIKTIGQKISKANKGKKRGPYSKEHREAISKAKKEKMTPKLREKLKDNIRKATIASHSKPYTKERKQKISESLKKAYAEGKRKTGKAPKPPTMSRKEQNKLCSEQLKERWNDPDWKQNQLEKLSQSAQKRWANTTIEQRARVPMPSKEDLEQLYPGNPFAFIAKKFNTSPPTVKKWLRHYELLN